jgi:hypothetical protein
MISAPTFHVYSGALSPDGTVFWVLELAKLLAFAGQSLLADSRIPYCSLYVMKHCR